MTGTKVLQRSRPTPNIREVDVVSKNFGWMRKDLACRFERRRTVLVAIDSEEEVVAYLSPPPPLSSVVMSQRNTGKMLYHGTRFLDTILRHDCLWRAQTGHTHVSLTTEFDVAREFATRVRETDEGAGGILAFREADLLASGFSLVPFPAVPSEHEIACSPDIWHVSRLVTDIIRFSK
jgi:hypothetical protein